MVARLDDKFHDMAKNALIADDAIVGLKDISRYIEHGMAGCRIERRRSGTT
jgi:hypothetical protein